MAPILLGLLLAGCTAQVTVSPTPSGSPSGGPAGPVSPTAVLSPSPIASVPPSPSPSPSPVAGYGVLVDLFGIPSQSTIALVAGDGSVAATIVAGRRKPIASAGGHAFDLPIVSTSVDSLYFLDGDSAVVRLVLGQAKVRVATLPTGPGIEGTFAVSPDNTQLAYGLLDFNRRPVHVQLGVIDLGAASQARVIFESDSDYVWPVAWHRGLIVLAHAYGPYRESVAVAGPYQANPYGAISYHLVDPATAQRRVLLGQCTVSGPLSAAGTACIQGGTLDWNGTDRNWGTRNWGSISAAASLSPNGSEVAAAEPADPSRLGIWRPDGTEATWVIGAGGNNWAGWLGPDLILTGSLTDAGFQPALIPIRGGPAVRVVARGFYAAHLPTAVG